MQLKPNSDASELIVPYVPEFSQQENPNVFTLNSAHRGHT